MLVDTAPDPKKILLSAWQLLNKAHLANASELMILVEFRYRHRL